MMLDDVRWFRSTKIWWLAMLQITSGMIAVVCPDVTVVSFCWNYQTKPRLRTGSTTNSSGIKHNLVLVVSTHQKHIVSLAQSCHKVTQKLWAAAINAWMSMLSGISVISDICMFLHQTPGYCLYIYMYLYMHVRQYVHERYALCKLQTATVYLIHNTREHQSFMGM